MRVAVLGASGATGRLLTSAARARGLSVVEIARSLPPPAVFGDVHDPDSIKRAVDGCDVLVSGLGVVRDSPPGTLAAGARAAVGSGVPRVIWLGAFGTGRTAVFASGLTRAVIGLALRRELADKAAADEIVLAAGGTVFHAGPLTNAPGSRAFLPRRFFPATISRSTVAAAMIDEAIRPQNPGRIVTALA
ncbi:NAD(P)-dependent oxidoreductase [Paractinoplanes lichenicola]|uniref:SDR family oxidoreductase n=1 Tax=Paractinoplanes lichenicola TaxID=2802976 RepID=A0ABS1VLF7_9ACTN|nr:NAD(P)-binding oxidoreductase [Actinoplanes lichenicola]MBL7255551.1 SDR family oxidoreductase [Actinoplanes lichenicola]